ncbi:MAG: Fic family protein [Gemmatimonadaceae bacterium]
MRRQQTGRYETTTTLGETVRAFVPDSLPPNPALVIDAEMRELLDSALLELGRLDSVTTLLPVASRFLHLYIRKEAVLSSQIEGIESSLSDLLLFELDEMPGVPINDVQEVSNYVAALSHGMRRMRADFPLSNRLIREIHRILLGKGRGKSKQPGELRRSQNWIGGTRPGNAHFVPPPAHLVESCMSELEKWMHDIPERTPTLLKAALAHVQLETIHPFLDGNGRVGRLLITLLLCQERVLREPLLYLSLYFKQKRPQYYAHLDAVRATGDWESWVTFFTNGVIETARSAVSTAQRLVHVVEEDRSQAQSLGRGAGSALRVLIALQEHPLSSVPRLAKSTGLTQPSVKNAVDSLAGLGIVREITGKRRGRIYSYEQYLRILAEGTALLD